jgi:phenylalanine-4-hydroxylase
VSHDAKPPAPSAAAPFAGGVENLVELDRDHPGFRDLAYRARRDAIARAALQYREGDSPAPVDYTAEEHEVWRTVSRELGILHARYASAEAKACAQLVALPTDRVPQLAEVNARLAQAGTGMQMLPVAGLVAPRTFLVHLARGMFLSTQYMRHHSAPLYTPEPDVIHELVGHAGSLAHPEFARLSRLFGRAAEQASADGIEQLTRLYWYTLEFGLVREGGALKAYGAGLLSSFGELGRFETQAHIENFAVEKVLATPYDPTDYQRVLFVVRSFASMGEELSAWLCARYRLPDA